MRLPVGSTNSENTETTNYEISNTTTTTVKEPGEVKKLAVASYTDYSLTLSKAFDNITVSGALVGTDTDAYVGPGNKDLGKRGVVASVKFVF